MILEDLGVCWLVHICYLKIERRVRGADGSESDPRFTSQQINNLISQTWQIPWDGTQGVSYKGKLIQPLHISPISHQTTNQSASLPLNGCRSVQLHSEVDFTTSTAAGKKGTGLLLVFPFVSLCRAQFRQKASDFGEQRHTTPR